MEQQTFGDWLEAKLRAKGAETQREMEALTGVNHSTLNRWLNGVGYPDRANQKRLAAALGVDRDELEALIDAERGGGTLPARPRHLTDEQWEAVAVQTVGRAVWSDLDESAKAVIRRLVRKEGSSPGFGE